MKKKKYRLILSAIPLLLALLCLSACTTEEEVIWDEVFADTLHLNEESKQKLSGHLQDINLTSTHDDVTVHLKQTLGDAKTLYMTMDVTFPADVDLQTMIAEPQDAGEIIPRNMAILAGKAEAADIKGLSWQEIKDEYNYDWILFVNGTDALSSLRIEKTSYDFVNHTISYLICFNSDVQRLNVDTVTLFVGNFVLDDGDTDLSLNPEIHTITWSPQNKSDVRELQITAENGASRGNIVLSPFSFNAYVIHSEFKTADEFDQSIQFIHMDGSEMQRPIFLLGDFAHSSGMAIIRDIFPTPMDIDNIKEIRIGGYTVNVQAK